MHDHDVPSEVEGKLRIATETTRRALDRMRAIARYRLRPKRTQRLHSIYVDTADFALARHGIALRLRRDSGRWEATAKWSGEVDGAVHDRPELTVPLPRRPELPFSLPEGPLRTHLTVHVLKRPLNAVLVTDIHRRRADVLPSAHTRGAPVAEIALDRVVLRGPQDDAAVASYGEVEIEGRPETRRAVEEVTEELRRRYDLEPSAETKFAAGMRLLYGGDEIRPTAPLPVVANDRLAAAARKIVGRQLERLKRHDPGTRVGLDPEALHDMRVATRRLRAAMRTFQPAIPVQLHRELHADLRWLGGVLGAVRDLDVQLARFERDVAALPGAYRTALEPLRRHIEADRALHRINLVEALDSPRYFRLLARLERFSWSRPRPERLPPLARQSVTAFGAQAVEKGLRRLLKQGRRISPTAPPDQLHKLRIRAKRLRYLLEFLSDLTGKPGRQTVKHLVRLQDALGAFNDDMVLADLVCRYLDGAGKASSASVSLAAQEVAQGALRHSEAVRAEFRRYWKRLGSKKAERRHQALLGRLHNDGAAQRGARR